MRRHLLIGLVLLIGLLGSLSGMVPALADPLRNEADAAIAWLGEQANPDGTLSTIGTEPDMSLTLDAALAAMAAGAPPDVVDGWIDAAEPHAEALSADHGRMAKALVVLAAAGRPTTSYGGTDPERIVRAAVTADGADAGHVAGTNAFGQSLAMIGMARTGDLPASTVTFLGSQQCRDGGFPINFASDPARHCDAAGTTPDPDGTAMAIMALRAAEDDGIHGAEDVRLKATAWLVAQQQPDGSFAGHPSFTPNENTNSTGLAAAALSGLEPAAVSAAGDWVRGLQITSGEDAGAIAYDRASLDSAGREVSRVGRGQWALATVQGTFALAPTSLHTLGAEVTAPDEPGDATEPTAPFAVPGEHAVDGHRWRTTCEPDEWGERCHTEIWARTVLVEDDLFVARDAWVFNRSLVVAVQR